MSRRRWLWGAGALLLLAVLGAGSFLAYRYAEPRQRARDLQAKLKGQKASARSCQQGVMGQEDELREFDGVVDSLRARIDTYEGLHPEGVPADSFPVYLRVFDEYNEAVEEWERRAGALQEDWESCTELVQEHNVMADSLRDILVDIGELDPATGEGDT